MPHMAFNKAPSKLIGSFGCLSSIHLLPELLKAYSERYPHIEIYVEEGTDAEVSRWVAERQSRCRFCSTRASRSWSSYAFANPRHFYCTLSQTSYAGTSQSF